MRLSRDLFTFNVKGMAFLIVKYVRMNECITYSRFDWLQVRAGTGTIAHNRIIIINKGYFRET